MIIEKLEFDFEDFIKISVGQLRYKKPCIRINGAFYSVTDNPEQVFFYRLLGRKNAVHIQLLNS